jgi:enoyl-CoA hydratase
MIDVRTENSIAVLTMKHGKANTLDTEFCDALAARLTKLGRSDAGAVVITGQGTIFSAGVDLKRYSEDGADYIRTFLPSLDRLYDAAFNLSKPLIAAVNGYAIAGGAVLACCADRRVMSAGRIGITELQVGVPFPARAFEVVRFAVPHHYLSEFALGATTYATDEALKRGWVDEVVTPGELMPRALAVAQQYASLSPVAFAQTKKQIREPAAVRLAASGAATDKAVTHVWTAPKTLDYVRAYVARTLKNG